MHKNCPRNDMKSGVADIGIVGDVDREVTVGQLVDQVGCCRS
jgi:hypothetical protein